MKERYQIIDPKKSSSKEIDEFKSLLQNPLKSRKYQKEAYDKLNDFLYDDSRVSGMLVLPTGAGKTRVSVSWAIHKAINEGYKVLWIAHRHMLLEQAYDTFEKFAPLCNKDSFSLIAVSSKHHSFDKVNFKKQDVVIISNQSISGQFTKKLQSVDKLLVIVDEAHHSTANTYKKWIGLVDKRKKYGKLRQILEERKLKNLKILGLTATPINTNKKKEKELRAIYGNQEHIYTISTTELMKSGILSRPILYSISTDVEIDANKIEGKTYKQKEDSINKQLVDNMERNEQIVRVYKKSFQNGKTLVFAYNIEHAMKLKSVFKKEGVKCEIVHSGQKRDINEQNISEFKDKDSDLNVLINVNILTEGSDIPNIQNLFITRVVISESLYTQMIGRALRGVSSGGTKTANIVTFKDNIQNFNFLSLREVFENEGWVDEDVVEKFFSDFEIFDEELYSKDEITEKLNKEHIDDQGRVFSYNLVDKEVLQDDILKEYMEKKDHKLYPYLVGVRNMKKDKDKDRWVFPKEKAVFDFRDKSFSDVKDWDTERFYFIVQKKPKLIYKEIDLKTWEEEYELLKSTHNLSDDECLPSYGKPLGEYKLYDKDEELIDIIPVFKYQKNSYERFFKAYFDEEDDFIKTLSPKEIQERYFTETDNFLPVNETKIEQLLNLLKTPVIYYEFEEYDLELMDEVEDIIDNLARRYAAGKSFNFNIEYKENPILHKIYKKREFENEVLYRSDIYLGEPIEVGNIVYIPKEALKLTKYKYLDEENFNKIHNLEILYQNAAKEICKNLNIKKLQHTPEKAQWTKKAYKSYYGIARGIDIYTRTIDDKSKLEINSILCSRDIPSYVIEFILYHEMLHFELKEGHSRTFRKYEKMFSKYEEAQKVLSEVGDWLDEYWERKKEKKWELYSDKSYTLDEARDIVQKENLKLPNIEDLKNIVKEEGSIFFHKTTKEGKGVFYLANDLKSAYSSFKISIYEDFKRKYKLIVWK